MIKQTQRLAKVWETGRKRFYDAHSSLWDIREQSQQDRRFLHVPGGQYEGEFGDQYENRPKPEINKCRLSHMRIVSAYRRNPVTADFVAKDGSDKDHLASTCDSLHRNDEHSCNAEETYINALSEAVGGGYGAWRLRAVEEDEYDPSNEYQRITFEPVNDADVSLFWDPNAKKQDKSDAKWAHLIFAMSREAYEDEYGDDPTSWPRPESNDDFDWATDDFVYLSEYYVCEIGTENIRMFESLTGEIEYYKDWEFDEDQMLEPSLYVRGWRETGQKTVKVKQVRKYILSGGGVVEDCGIIPGPNIPIVPVYGHRTVINGIERASGDVRTVKDAQRIYNMLISFLAELSANSPMQKPIFAPEQINEFRQWWEKDAEENYRYLLANPLYDGNGNIVQTGPLEYTKPPDVPQALAALIGVVNEDIKELLGNQERGEEVVSNISGKAVELIQSRLDQQTFIYLDQMAKAHKRSGEIWLGMAKELYVESGRKMRGIGPEGETSTIEIQRPIIGEDGEIQYENDLSNAEFDIYADAGPSSASKKAATVREIQGMLQLSTIDPESATVLLNIAIANMEGEGVEDAREWARKRMLKMGVGTPTKEEAADMQKELQALQQQPDPNALFLESEARKNDAQARKLEADTTLTLVKTEETQAKTAETLAGIDREDRQQAIDAAKALKEAASAQPRDMGER